MLQDTKKQNTGDIGELFTINEVSAKLKISRDTLYRLTRDKEIKTVKVGNSVRYTREGLNQLIEGGDQPVS